MSHDANIPRNGNGGPTWKIIATALAAVAWMIVFGLVAWNLKTTIDLKTEIARVEVRLNMAPGQASQPASPSQYVWGMIAGSGELKTLNNRTPNVER